MRKVVVGSVCVIVLALVAVAGTAIVAALLAVSGSTDVRVGAALVVSVIGGLVAATARWLTRSAVPRWAGRDYQTPTAAWSRSVVLGAVVATSLLAAVATVGEGLAGAALWLAVMGTGGVLGVRSTKPPRLAP